MVPYSCQTVTDMIRKKRFSRTNFKRLPLTEIPSHVRLVHYSITAADFIGFIFNYSHTKLFLYEIQNQIRGGKHRKGEEKRREKGQVKRVVVALFVFTDNIKI